MLVMLKKDEAGNFLPLDDGEISTAMADKRVIRRPTNHPESRQELLEQLIEGLELKEQLEGMA